MSYVTIKLEHPVTKDKITVTAHMYGCRNDRQADDVQGYSDTRDYDWDGLYELFGDNLCDWLEEADSVEGGWEEDWASKAEDAWDAARGH